MRIGFIDYYLDEWHANNYPKMLSELSRDTIRVTGAYGMITSPLTGMTSEQWCQNNHIEHYKTEEEVIDNSDAIIILSPDNCEMHEQLSERALKSGKITYIDKTFAPTKKTAEKIFLLAETHGTPCFSTSALRFAQEYKELKNCKLESGVFLGPGNMETYGIHQLEPMFMLMKGKVKKVMSVCAEPWTQTMLAWDDGRVTSMTCTQTQFPFVANVNYANNNKEVRIELDYFSEFIKGLIQFFETGIEPVAHKETIDIMSTREACIKSLCYLEQWISVE